jgi:hypothetical protein
MFIDAHDHVTQYHDDSEITSLAVSVCKLFEIIQLWKIRKRSAYWLIFVISVQFTI